MTGKRDAWADRIPNIIELFLRPNFEPAGRNTILRSQFACRDSPTGPDDLHALTHGGRPLHMRSYSRIGTYRQP